MKSAVIFTLLAAMATVNALVTHDLRPISIGSEEKDCPKYCLDIHDPVGDEEGNMYSNECYMKRAKCAKNKPTDPPFWKSFKFSNDGSTTQETPKRKCSSGCPDVELPVCGSDGVRYGNPCELKIAACEHPELNIVEAVGMGCRKSRVQLH
ncbi:Kazal-type serine protease inhibitor domain [Phytophthora infestans]|uniref:Kazal-type serine protease inhibitor domain n=1 Tax=Phytophthora infestans TaxID=4787 RepID=A0A8S9V436_PHYIN|nr:Kazal-type serine protease inhibitor domain [Phytophthora infestans]